MQYGGIRDAVGIYDDIIDLPHHVSDHHPRMTRAERAVQFAPFAALTGFGAQISETARQTSARPIRDEAAEELLDRKLRFLAEHIGEQPEITVLCFLSDEKKKGGAYRKVTGRCVRLDIYDGLLFFSDGEKLQLCDILSLDGALFGCLAE